MPVENLLLAVNTSLTLSIGVISLIIVYGASKGMEDESFKEYSNRLALVIAVLILYVFYWGLYNYAWKGITLAKYPLYLALIFIFIYMIWSVMSFQKLASKYGVSNDRKLEKMKEEEGRN